MPSSKFVTPLAAPHHMRATPKARSLSGWLKLSIACACLLLIVPSAGARAATPFMCTGGPGEQQIGIDTTNPSVPVPICVSAPSAPDSSQAQPGARRDITPYRPPGYKPPPRPKGWQKLWSGFAEFVVAVEPLEGGDEKLIYDYALALNYPGEEQAREAAQGMCRLRAIFPRAISNYNESVEAYCRSKTLVLEEPFIRIGIGRTGDYRVGQDVNPVRAANISRVIDGKSYNCSSDDLTTPEFCNYWVLAIIPNGLHPKASATGFDHVSPCPDGPPDERYKIVGLDNKTGLFVPLCGPDLKRWP